MMLLCWRQSKNDSVSQPTASAGVPADAISKMIASASPIIGRSTSSLCGSTCYVETRQWEKYRLNHMWPRRRIVRRTFLFYKKSLAIFKIMTSVPVWFVSIRCMCLNLEFRIWNIPSDSDRYLFRIPWCMTKYQYLLPLSRPYSAGHQSRPPEGNDFLRSTNHIYFIFWSFQAFIVLSHKYKMTCRVYFLTYG